MHDLSDPSNVSTRLFIDGTGAPVVGPQSILNGQGLSARSVSYIAPSSNQCDTGYYYDQESGFCVPDGQFPPVGSGVPPEIEIPPLPTIGSYFPGALWLLPILGGGDTTTPPFSGTTTATGNATINLEVKNAISITDEGIDKIAQSVTKGITDSANQVDTIIDRAGKKIENTIAEETDSIKGGIQAANDNLTHGIEVSTGALAASTAATVGTIGSSIGGLVDDVKKTITPILTTIGNVIHDINAQIQKINDTLIEPIANVYNSTIGTITTLTTAIETDLHEGISGLLKFPGQLADQLGSLDATLDRTIQQLGVVNQETVTTGIDYLNKSLPKPFSDAFSKALGGKTLGNSLTTTFGGTVTLSSESLSQVGAGAIGALGTLLREIMGIISETFSSTLENLHANWKDVESVFIGLLDGLLSLLTTITAMGAVTGPLVEAAEEEAHKLIPITKLDPATVIEALRRGFLTTADALAELRTKGIDATRSQVLIDLSVFLADGNMALDWWYRGIISDTDFIDNLRKHGYEPEDITAFKQGSIHLPSIQDLLRWMNFGLITRDQFIHNTKVLRYDDAEITAILSTYQERESPQTLAALTGLLNNSSASFLNSTLNLPVPDTVSAAGSRFGYHPDLTRYIWLAHWQIPDLHTFVQAYFRGIRTKTELEERFAIANIPRELWDDIITVNRSLIPYRSIPSFVTHGYMTAQRAEQELAAHGFDLEHIQLILKSVKAPVDTVNQDATQQIQTISVSNAKALWTEDVLTDSQYAQILIAHGYTAETAALQLRADSVSRHIKQQKATLSELTAEVKDGSMTADDAIALLRRGGFTDGQIAKFSLSVNKVVKSAEKIPSIPELNKFFKAKLITAEEYAQALYDQGWRDPWLSAFMGLITAPEDTTQPTS